MRIDITHSLLVSRLIVHDFFVSGVLPAVYPSASRDWSFTQAAKLDLEGVDARFFLLANSHNPPRLLLLACEFATQ